MTGSFYKLRDVITPYAAARLFALFLDPPPESKAPHAPAEDCLVNRAGQPAAYGAVDGFHVQCRLSPTASCARCRRLPRMRCGK